MPEANANYSKMHFAYFTSETLLMPLAAVEKCWASVVLSSLCVLCCL